MASVVVRRLDETAKELLRARAKRRGRSLEAEIRDVLETAARDASATELGKAAREKGFGTLMHERFESRGLTPREKRRLERAMDELRDRSLMGMPDFEEW